MLCTVVLDVFQVVARGMVERGGGGAIVHVSSIRSQAAGTDRLSYCISKSALDQVMRVMALELGPYQVSIVIFYFLCYYCHNLFSKHSDHSIVIYFLFS